MINTKFGVHFFYTSKKKKNYSALYFWEWYGVLVKNEESKWYSNDFYNINPIKRY